MPSEVGEQGRGAAAAGSAEVALHRRLQARRRELGLSQQALAERAGVRQSAISAYERRGEAAHALSAEGIRLVAEVLGVRCEEGEVTARSAAARLGIFYCPNSECSAAWVYAVGLRTVYRPRFIRAEAGQRLHCPDCGEVCEEGCPTCHAPLSERLRGAFCVECGAAYVEGDELSEDEIGRRADVRAELAAGAAPSEYRHGRASAPTGAASGVAGEGSARRE